MKNKGMISIIMGSAFNNIINTISRGSIVIRPILNFKNSNLFKINVCNCYYNNLGICNYFSFNNEI